MTRHLGALLVFAGALATAPSVACGQDEAEFRFIHGGPFHSSVRFETSGLPMKVASFSLMARPVSNAQFADFLQKYPHWQRGQVPALFSSPGYLAGWSTSNQPGDEYDPTAPVVQVTWHAAAAYCQAHGARLPTFLEWEYAAAADETRQDARHDKAWRNQQVQDGSPYAPDAQVGARANVYGIYALHGEHWEWVDDAASLLGDGDRRSRNDGQALRYCGASSLAFDNPQDYAVVKRFILLSALKPNATLGNLGFRCARSEP